MNRERGAVPRGAELLDPELQAVLVSSGDYYHYY